MKKKKKDIIECADCKKIFSTLWSLKRHRNKLHTSVRCTDCGKMLASKGNY